MSLKLPENKEEALHLAELAVDGLNAIVGIVAPAKAESAAGAITLIRVLLATLEEGFNGKITHDRVRQELHKLVSSIKANDETADVALDKKFTNNP